MNPVARTDSFPFSAKCRADALPRVRHAAGGSFPELDPQATVPQWTDPARAFHEAARPEPASASGFC